MILIFLGILIFVICLLIKSDNIKTNKSTNTDIEISNKIYNIYKIKPIMTENEKNFYNKIKELENEYKIIPQLNLASITKKQTNNKFYNELFRNIDFAIFSKDFEQPLLLIELNDKTHNEYKRKDRDLKVKKICNDIGIKLITFYTYYPNEKEYVINRIKKEINNLEKNDTETNKDNC